MSTNPTENSTYQKRTKPTRTHLFRKIWGSLEKAERPDVLGWMCWDKIRINPDYAPILKAAGLDTMAGVYQTQLGEIISQDGKKEKNDVLRIELEDEGRTRVFYLKRYWNREWSKIWKRAPRGALLGPSIVKAEFEKMERLGEYGIRIPGLVAFGNQRFCGGVINSFIMTEEIPKAMGVDFVVGAWMEQQPKELHEIHREALLAEVARCLKIMHAHGFEHHDLFLRNMMISGQDMTALYILDCPRAYIWPWFIMRFRRVHDLATLDAAASELLRPTQRMRFMHLYLGRNQLTDEDKQLVRKVLKRADPMRARQVARLDRSIPVDEDGNILNT